MYLRGDQRSFGEESKGERQIKGVLQGLVCKPPELTRREGDTVGRETRGLPTTPLVKGTPGATKPARTGHSPPPPVLGLSGARGSTEKFSSLACSRSYPAEGCRREGSVQSPSARTSPPPVHPGTAGQGGGLELRGKERLQALQRKRGNSGTQRGEDNILLLQEETVSKSRQPWPEAAFCLPPAVWSWAGYQTALKSYIRV